jgi:CRP-like cAMP-binding protein
MTTIDRRIWNPDLNTRVGVDSRKEQESSGWPVPSSLEKAPGDLIRRGELPDRISDWCRPARANRSGSRRSNTRSAYQRRCEGVSCASRVALMRLTAREPPVGRSSQSYQNRLLELLDPADLARLQPELQAITFEYRQSLYESGKPIDDVYFPITGVASLVNTMASGAAAEVGTIGNEGMVGLPIILGDRIAPTSVYVQVPGSGWRLPAKALVAELSRSDRTRSVLLRYVHAFFNQVAQSAACNHFHKVEQRCCRWLLMTHDRVQSEHFLLTQEFLGMMLGVRRSSVTDAAHNLKKLKLIEYQRGHVTILNRRGLEQRACECYAVSKNEFDRLLGDPLGLGVTA